MRRKRQGRRGQRGKRRAGFTAARRRCSLQLLLPLVLQEQLLSPLVLQVGSRSRRMRSRRHPLWQRRQHPG